MTPDPSPKLPFWVFVVSDVALLATAWLIAEHSQQPLSPAAVAGITGCAALGTLVLLVPLLLRYERQKNEALDERQRALEGIARTVHESAEQLSIAANGLNQIAGLARESLQTAEGLPDKLKTQLAALETKTASAHEAERSQLAKELAALRKTNAEQLANTAAQIIQVTGDWTKLEAATRQHFAQAQEALGKLEQTAAAQISAAHATALAELEARLKSLPERVPAAVSVTPSDATSTPPPSAEVPPAEPITTPSAVAEPQVQASSESVVAAASTPTPAPVTPPTPKRPRKPRREPATEVQTATPTPTGDAASATPPTEVPPVTPAVAEPTSEVAAAPAVEVNPVPAAEVNPAPTNEPSAPAAQAEVAQDNPAPAETAVVTPEPSPAQASPTAPESTAPSEPSPVLTAIVTPAVSPAPTESPRKRAARAKPEATPEPMLDMVIDDSMPPVRAMERGLSSDGATRMIVTAYIGIGNRLFIRGEGPGLSPDKGVPLQFVSIGKWRWETNDATTPIRFRILKNDSVECTGLGEQTLEPGYQAEFGASF